MDEADSDDMDLDMDMDLAAVEAWQRRSRSSNEIPASVVIDRPIGSSESLVVFISSLSVYSNGIGFTIELRGRGGLGSVDRPVHLAEGALGMVPKDDRLLLGIEFPDGRWCTTTPRGEEPNPTAEPVIVSCGGSGSNASATTDWFLAPFPPPGDLRLLCAWPSAGIPETSTIISGDELLHAAARVRELWPRPGVLDQQPDPTPVGLRSGGWFASRTPAPGKA